MTYPSVPPPRPYGQPQLSSSFFEDPFTICESVESYGPNVPISKPVDLDQTLSQFSDYLLVMKGLQPSTIEGCIRVISKVLRDLETLQPSHEQIMRYIVDLHGRSCSYSHIANNSLAIERYMAFRDDPIKLGRPRKQKWRVKNTLTEAQVAILLAACRNIREKAILSVLAYSGIRNLELCSLRVADIDMGHNVLHVKRGKGNKYRPVCIAAECVEVLQHYLREFPRPDDEYLFTNLRSGRQYTQWAVRRVVKVIAARTNIEKRVHPHLFRHSLATNLIGREASLLAVQGQLGHEHIQTTMIYIKTSFRRQQAEYNLRVPSYL